MRDTVRIRTVYHPRVICKNWVIGEIRSVTRSCSSRSLLIFSVSETESLKCQIDLSISGRNSSVM